MIIRDLKNESLNCCIEKDWVFPFSKVKPGSDIVLFGAGDVGQAYYDQICATGYCKIIKWVDSRYDTCEGLGRTIEAPNSITECEYDHVVIAVCDSKIAIAINDVLTGFGVDPTKVIWFADRRKTIRGNLLENRFIIPVRDRIKEFYRRRGINPECIEVSDYLEEIQKDISDKGMLIIPRLVLELTSVCSLRCDGCNNLMPMYERPQHVPVEAVLNDFRKLMEGVDGIITLELIGGEPFSYPWLKNVLEEVTKSDAVKEIEITTNGTIIPNESVLDTLKNKKITVKVSNYEFVTYNKDIAKVLFDNGIRYEKYNELKWIDSGGTDCRNRSSDELRKIYMKCSSAVYCKTLYKGRIYACARATGLYELGICNNEEGYVDIYKSENLRDDIRDFWLRLSDESCNYCDFTEDWRKIPAGKQLD